MILLAGALLSATGADARDVLGGPFLAKVDRVVDGDTLRVRVRIWVDQEVDVLVRLKGIDAPETRGRCPAERQLARRAKAYLAAAVQSGEVRLTNIIGGKYWGRVIADVTTTEGNRVASAMLAHGLVRPYRGRKRTSWCEGQSR